MALSSSKATMMAGSPRSITSIKLSDGRLLGAVANAVTAGVFRTAAALARKLVVLVWHVLRKQAPYRYGPVAHTRKKLRQVTPGLLPAMPKLRWAQAMTAGVEGWLMGLILLSLPFIILTVLIKLFLAERLPTTGHVPHRMEQI